MKNDKKSQTARHQICLPNLSAANIDLLAAEIFEILEKRMKLERKEALRLRLSVEEALIQWREVLGEEHECTLRYGKRLRRAFIELSIAGTRVNPYEQKDQDFGTGDEAQNLLSFYGLAPSYSYKNGVNRLTLMPGRKKSGTILRMLYAFVLAIAVGLVCQIFPESFRLTLAGQVIEPLFNTFMGLLAAIAGPLIFLSVLWGIYAIGDISMLGQIGKKMIGRFLLYTFLILILCTCGTFWMFDLNFSGAGGTENQLAEIYAMILNIIPSNIIAPFYEGNSLQIIFLAVITGLAMLVLKDKTMVVADFVEQINYIVQLIMDTIGILVPGFIFASVLDMLLTGALVRAASSLKVVLICCAASVAVIAVYAVLVSVKKKVSLGVLIKKLLPTMLIAITTSSSSAAFGTNVETCEKKLGIDKRIVNFGLPMGQVIFMPGAAILFLLMGFAMAEYYEITVSLSWILMALLVSGLLAVAAPPIPGGALSCYTILFLQLGIPTEAIAITIALNMILEFVATTVNLTSLQLELTLVSDKLGMLDLNTLRK